MRRKHNVPVVLLGALAFLAVASNAPALILTGGPVYTLPGGGSCTTSGTPTIGSGATVTCTGVNLAAHTNVYFGIKNNTNVNGASTDNGSITTGPPDEVFAYASETASSVTYTSATSISSACASPPCDFGTDSVANTMVVSLTAGSATIMATGGTPASSVALGDIERVFKLNSGSSFTFNVAISGVDPHFSGALCSVLYNGTHASAGAGNCRSGVDLAFYFSDCGDSVVDSPEQCDLGSANGQLTSCCTASCTFRTAGQVCRAGPGAPCDASELCTGAAGQCPPDDAPINLGVVCNEGSGDECDENETCTGVPGQGCPPDDAPDNTDIICRASTTGDVCDEDEFCSGIPDQTCPPDDAPSKLNFPCRPGSGDICDPTEQCTGIPGQACPIDIVANPSTVCRVGSGDACDPNETCTAIPTQPCPPDVVTPGGTICRAAAGVCDLAEQCSGTAGQDCPNNAFVSAGTSCNQDNSLCTVDECNGSGACVFDSNLNCDDSNSCTQDSCDPDDGCEVSGTPSNSCLGASKAVFKLKNKSLDSRDGVRFVWSGGPSLVGDMGDPTQTTRYELCVYDDTGVQVAMGVDPGTGWETVGSPSSPKGYKYKDKNALQDGIKLIKTKASNLDKAKVKVAGKGEQIPDTHNLPFQWPVTAQLYASDGMCWEAEFDAAHTRKNEEGGFTGKVP